MTDWILYEHSNVSGTLGLPVNILTLRTTGIKEVSKVTPADNKGTSSINDPNRVLRRWQFNCSLGYADRNEMWTYIQPAAVPSYDAYPRFAELYSADGTKEDDVKVLIETGCTDIPIGRDANGVKYLMTLYFKERL